MLQHHPEIAEPGILPQSEYNNFRQPAHAGVGDLFEMIGNAWAGTVWNIRTIPNSADTQGNPYAFMPKIGRKNLRRP